MVPYKHLREGQWPSPLLLAALLLLLVLSSCGFIPGPKSVTTPHVVTTQPLVVAHRPSLAVDARLDITASVPYAVAQQTLQTLDDGCSDMVYPELVSWQEVRIYFNDCALQHLSAIVASADAVTLFINLVCPECGPVADWLIAAAAVVTANIVSLQYASQQCGGAGAYLDISWLGGWQIEPVCSTQDAGS
jgi:hypothetical protein